MNPRRVEVRISPSFDINRRDLIDAYFSGTETNADDGDMMEKVEKIATDRMNGWTVMVDVLPVMLFLLLLVVVVV